jgi:protein gp37
MGDQTAIEWTDATWNPTVGCTRVSPGCKRCYAATMHGRLTGMRAPKYAAPFSDVRPWEPHLNEPLRWRRPRLIFVNSMSDLFHESVPLDYIQRVFDVVARAPQHRFQVLTKRGKRLRELGPWLHWPGNLWMGVSVESERYLGRISDLLDVPAAVRFLSIEPLLGPIPDLPLRGIHWVIVGGESGQGARTMSADWARQIRDQCLSEAVPFFLKQLGGERDKRGGAAALLDGRTWRAMPNSEGGTGWKSPM